MNHNIRPIGLQVFPRPGAQEGYGLHIREDESVKCYMYRFSFTCEDSRYYYEQFKNGEAIWIKDKFIAKAASIAIQNEFSFNVFDETFREFRPKGYSSTKLKKSLSGKVVLHTKIADVVFDESEKREIVEEWNNVTGRKFAEIIFRKRWFEHDEVQSDGEGKEVITGIRNEHAYRTLARISMMQMLNYIGCPDALNCAEWKNYTGKPRPKEKPRKDNGEWKKVPAHMEDMYGKPYLTEEDWMIIL